MSDVESNQYISLGITAYRFFGVVMAALIFLAVTE